MRPYTIIFSLLGGSALLAEHIGFVGPARIFDGTDKSRTVGLGILLGSLGTSDTYIVVAAQHDGVGRAMALRVVEDAEEALLRSLVYDESGEFLPRCVKRTLSIAQVSAVKRSDTWVVPEEAVVLILGPATLSRPVILSGE